MQTIDLTKEDLRTSNKRQRLDIDASYQVVQQEQQKKGIKVILYSKSEIEPLKSTNYTFDIDSNHALFRHSLVLRDMIERSAFQENNRVGLPFLDEKLCRVLLRHCELVSQLGLEQEPSSLLTDAQVADMHKTKWFLASLELVQSQYKSPQDLVELVTLCHTAFQIELLSLFHVTAYVSAQSISNIPPEELVKLFYCTTTTTSTTTNTC